MSEAVYQVMTALSTLVTPLPMGPNLGLLHLLWTLVSGRLLASRGALFPAVQETGLSDGQVRRAWAVIETGGTSDDVAAALGLRQAWMVKKLIPRARQVDAERLERIAAGLADLDFAIRGGGKVDTGTALTLTLAAA